MARARPPASPVPPSNPHAAAAAALQSAQRLKEERDDALRRLEQASLEQTMGAALAETQVRRAGAVVEWGTQLPRARLHSLRWVRCAAGPACSSAPCPSAFDAPMPPSLPQKLKDVADEFERDLYQAKLSEAEGRAAEAEGLRERIAELEEENAGACVGWSSGWDRQQAASAARCQ